MKKIKKIFMILISTSFLVVGCGTQMVELTPEENAVITEYAAALLLKYDKNHKSKILSDIQIEKEQEKQRLLEEAVNKKNAEKAEQETEKKIENSKVEEQQQIQEIDLAGFLEIEGFEIEYQNYEIATSYPTTETENVIFSIDAIAGKELVVLHFNIKNVSESSEVCDILSKKIRGGISVNGGDKRNVLVTMLLNDFTQFQSQIGPDPVDTVLIVEMKSEEIENIETIDLSLKYNGETITALLQ